MTDKHGEGNNPFEHHQLDIEQEFKTLIQSLQFITPNRTAVQPYLEAIIVGEPCPENALKSLPKLKLA